MSLVQHKEHEEAEEGQSLHKITKQQLQADVTNVLEMQGSTGDQMKCWDITEGYHLTETHENYLRRMSPRYFSHI